MLAQCRRFKPVFAVMASAPHGSLLAEKIRDHQLPTQVLSGPAALEMIASHESVDAVMAAIVGAAGLPPCMAAVKAGKRLLLANKEALVVGGEVFMQAVRQGGAQLLPIDSEHSAIFQSLPEDPSTWADRVEKIILTASGGPFRERDPDTLQHVTPDQACAHPNWVMGRKISVDSATMMNKALEVIEARWLFDLAPDRIKVVIHPQSIIHSMVVCRDNSVLAQLGTPDMKVPISVGLAWPGRAASGADALDFLACRPLTFEPADHARFPGLGLAFDALRAPEGSTTVLNAANEVAVEAFLNGQIGFLDIANLVEATLTAYAPAAPTHLDDLFSIDADARIYARHELETLTRGN
jgi:1-deoxy-D-xylulose-5-phosphate reductoisomerase